MILNSRGLPQWLPIAIGFGGTTWLLGRGSHFAAPFAPLVVDQQLHSMLVATSLSLTPWSIDPERTQELTELTSPSVDAWSDSYSSTVIRTSPSQTAWSIDPERTQELTR